MGTGDKGVEEIKTDLLIIGAGPGGLAAALYARRAGLDFEIVEKNMPGGQIINTESVENYPGIKKLSGFELSQKLVDHCRDFGIEAREYLSIDKVEKAGKKSKDNDYRFKCSGEEGVAFAKSLIIATGASPSRLDVEGEKEFIGKGISFCATCDGALFRDKEVAVIGGGDTAVEEALFLTNLVKKVYLVHRRDELRACDMLQCRAKENSKIEFLWSSIVEKFMGKEMLEEILVRNKKEDRTYTLKVDGAFIYVGLNPNSQLVGSLVKLDEKGFIITGPTMETSTGGIFAVGDVRNTPLRQVVTAVSDGAIAAMHADKFLGGLA